MLVNPLGFWVAFLDEVSGFMSNNGAASKHHHPRHHHYHEDHCLLIIMISDQPQVMANNGLQIHIAAFSIIDSLCIEVGRGTRLVQHEQICQMIWPTIIFGVIKSQTITIVAPGASYLAKYDI